MRNVSIVGCGMLGSMIAHPISAHANALDVVLKVKLIDGDKVEERNSPANLGVPKHVGAYKVDVVQGYINGLASVDTYLGFLHETHDQYINVLKGTDLIVGAVDNIKTRLLLHDASFRLGVPYIDMGINNYSGVVSWTNKTVDTMPFANPDIRFEMPQEEEKVPACTLVSTRLMSAIVTECATKSMFIYLSGHDPFNLVMELTNKKAKTGDMVGWNVFSGGGEIRARPMYLGNLG